MFSKCHNQYIKQAALATLVWPLFPAILVAQGGQMLSPLTLQEAVNVALEKNPEHKAALADVNSASAGLREAQSALFPRATFSEAVTRGNDPVYVFGSKLRQQRFSTSDFALNMLNTPTPFWNFATHFGGTWNVFDSFASWRNINRAQQVKHATEHQLERADQEIVFHVVDSYYGVLFAKKQLDVAEQAVKTGEAIQDRSKNRFESGVVVESDYLSAQVRLAARKQELIRAQNNLAFARAQLNVAMGLPAADQFDPVEALMEKNLPATSLDEMEKEAVEKHPDLMRIQSEELAQRQSVRIAKSAFGPRVNATAGWEADNPTFVAGGGGNNWMAGIEIQVDLFQGGAKRAELSREQSVQEKLAAGKEIASNAIRLEVRRTYYEVNTARQQVDVARTAVRAAQESLRINQDRYDSGLLTIADLLAAEEAARRTQTDYWESIYRYHTGYAALELAAGTLNPQSPVVTP